MLTTLIKYYALPVKVIVQILGLKECTSNKRMCGLVIFNWWCQRRLKFWHVILNCLALCDALQALLLLLTVILGTGTPCKLLLEVVGKSTYNLIAICSLSLQDIH